SRLNPTTRRGIRPLLVTAGHDVIGTSRTESCSGSRGKRNRSSTTQGRTVRGYPGRRRVVDMGMVMAVTFTRYGRLYYLDPGPHSPRVGDKVLVPTDDGPEVAECVWAPQWVTEDEIGR